MPGDNKCTPTMADSGPAWSSKSSKSSPMISVSKSWLVWGIGQCLLVLHPLTNAGTGRGTEVGTDVRRGTDSKPGGSDGVKEEILLVGGSSSTTASFRGEWTATVAWIGAGTAAMIPSWVSQATSNTQMERQGDVLLFWALNCQFKAGSTYLFLCLQLKTSYGETEMQKKCDQQCSCQQRMLDYVEEKLLPFHMMHLDNLILAKHSRPAVIMVTKKTKTL